MQRRGLLPFSSEGSTAFFAAWGARENTGTIRRKGIMQMQIFRKVGLGTNVPCAGAGPIPTPQACPQGSSVTITGTLTAADLSCKDATATSPAVNNFADAVAQIKAGNTYTNVHSQANPGGDIRGTD